MGHKSLRSLNGRSKSRIIARSFDRGYVTRRKKLSHPLPNLFPIVGVGASAGGLEAFKHFLSSLPTDTGMGFVFIQHLDPKHESMSADILSRITKMPVAEVKDGTQVKPNHVYVIPPNFGMGIMRGVLKLLPRPETRGHQKSIDFFFGPSLKTERVWHWNLSFREPDRMAPKGWRPSNPKGASPLLRPLSPQNSRTCRNSPSPRKAST